MADVVVPVDAELQVTETDPLVPEATLGAIAEASNESWRVRTHSWRFWWTWFVRLVVFSLTGSLSVRLTSLFVHVVGFKGGRRGSTVVAVCFDLLGRWVCHCTLVALPHIFHTGYPSDLHLSYPHHRNVSHAESLFPSTRV